MLTRNRLAIELVAVVGLTVAVLAFLTVRLPSIERMFPEPTEFPRWNVLLYVFLPDTLAAQWTNGGATWAILDRVPLLVSACVILLAAWTIGDLVLAVMRLRKRLDRLEGFVFAAAVGLSLLSTATLLAGLAHMLSPWIVRSGLTAFALIGGVRVAMIVRRRLREKKPNGATPRERLPVSVYWALGACVPFAIVLLLGAMLPPVEFDVREYHLQAPKEFFQGGGVAFTPHNVYSNMPLGGEMLTLLAMHWQDDWWSGALLGKLLLGCCTLLTAVAVFAAGRRFQGPLAGAVGALLYLATPWVARVSTSGLIEGVYALYLFLAVYALLIRYQSQSTSEVGGRYAWFALAGFLAGGAVACKYPAVLLVVLPLAAAAEWIEWRRSLLMTLAAGASVYFVLLHFDSPVVWAIVLLLFGAVAWIEWDRRRALSSRSEMDESTRRERIARIVGAAPPWLAVAVFLLAAGAASGAWFARNAVATGNPTYPLLHSTFGDASVAWDVDKDARWTRVHSPHDFSVADFTDKLNRVAWRSEWLSPILWPLALLAFVPRSTRPIAIALAAYVVYVLAAWWLLTHRLDRFWIPVLPIVALLAGMGCAAFETSIARRAVAAPIVLATFYGLLVVVMQAPEYNNRFFEPLASARTDVNRVGDFWTIHYNAHPPTGKLMLVGDAAVFDHESPILYNTCFNDSAFEEAVKDRTPEEAREALEMLGVSDILVNWAEIDRYRSPGNYGYTDFVQPEVLDELVEAGVLAPYDPPRSNDELLDMWRDMSRSKAYRVRPSTAE